MLVVMFEDKDTVMRVIRRHKDVVKAVIIVVDTNPETIGGLAKYFKENGAIILKKGSIGFL